MRVISKRTLKAFYAQAHYSDSQSALEAWHHEVLKVVWNNPNEIKAQYKSASIVGDNKVVFNICGNKYRLIVKINYMAGIVFIKFIGTHKQYDKIRIEEL
ncbi:type II toxin-antitoxin system HigB family toxin [Sulfurovum riftiae]|uniref:Addiction module toxin RelE n=1 Tax=Sulfurovum riftiae TaxID=1630136 RepID=A0A151CDI0_9BACT|nr:type II toxin-antitoxin system HigB family toxin [Sulfurovum riftiae]KYJ85577.1 addiction module toxin RelE [Sulfurovum riftiae]